MTHLFSAFDPSAIFGTSLNWVSSSLIFLAVPGSIFLTTPPTATLMNQSLKYLSLEFKSVFGPLQMPGSSWFILSYFLFIFLNNVLGLFPYIFTSTSHMSLGLSLALPLWMGHITYSWAKQPQYALAHLVPLGTPPALTSFMVLIEVVSNIIRPLTLSVRLMANLTAGHLLLCLLSSLMPLSLANPVALVTLSGLSVLLVLEVAVSLIQAYVFTLLTSLYLEEVQTPLLVKS